MRIALDAMGGDNAPGPNIMGALQATAQSDELHVALVGDPTVLESSLTGAGGDPTGRISIVEADGTPRPEWADKFLAALPKARRARPEQWGISEQWADGLRALAQRAKGEGEIVAAAFFRPSGRRKR